MKSTRPFNRQNSCRCVEYWLVRGYTEEQARLQISNLQRRKPEVYKKAAASKQTTEFRDTMSEKMKEVYTQQYWVDKLGEELGTAKYNSLIATSHENGQRSGEIRSNLSDVEKQKQSCWSASFWIDRGFTPEQAEEEISKRQARGLQHYITKYGETEGRERWQDRQIRWQKSFQQNNDMRKVNDKRRAHSHIGLYTHENVRDISDLCFYLVKFIHKSETFLKFGLTKHCNGYRARWGQSKYGATIVSLIEWRSSGEQCFMLEQDIKTKFAQYQYSPKLFTTTEALQSNAESSILPYILSFINNGVNA